MKTKFFLFLLGAFCLIVSSPVLAVDDNIIRQMVAEEITVPPVAEDVEKGVIVESDLEDLVAEEIAVPRSVPRKGQWMALNKGETVSGLAYRYCESKNRDTVEQILKANDLTWESAKKLPVGYEFFVPAELLSGEFKNPLARIAETQEDLIREQMTITHLTEKSNRLADKNIQLAKKVESFKKDLANVNSANTEIEYNYKKLKEKVSGLRRILPVSTISVLILCFLLFVVAFKLSRANIRVKELQSIMRLGRLCMKIGDKEYAFYCPIDTENRYNIAPFKLSGGDSWIQDKNLARETVEKHLKAYLQAYLQGVVLPVVKEMLNSGRIVELQRKTYVEPEAKENSGDS